MRLAKLVAFILFLAYASSSQADSFMTSIGSGSKAAAKVGPKPYTLSQASKIQRRGAVARAIKVIQRGNVASAMDAIRSIDSMAMDNPKLGSKFLNRLGKLRSPKGKFALAYYTLMQAPESTGAVNELRRGAKLFPNDSAVQLGTFQGIAQHAFFGGHMTNAALYEEAATYLKKARAIEDRSHYGRPLVRKAIREALDYVKLYPEFSTSMTTATTAAN